MDPSLLHEGADLVQDDKISLGFTSHCCLFGINNILLVSLMKTKTVFESARNK
jgi:hypothetical protein